MDDATFYVIVILFFGSLAYFAPAILATARHHPKAPIVWLVNTVAGWTLIGWGIAFILAIEDDY